MKKPTIYAEFPKKNIHLLRIRTLRKAHGSPPRTLR